MNLENLSPDSESRHFLIRFRRWRKAVQGITVSIHRNFPGLRRGTAEIGMAGEFVWAEVVHKQ